MVRSILCKGRLMTENIKKYNKRISARNRSLKLQSELERWTNILKNKYNPEKIILFGSFADGKIGEWSDVDLIIIKDIEKPFLKRIEEVLLLLHPEAGVDVLVYTSQEFKNLCETRLFFKEEISKKGVIIYER